MALFTVATQLRTSTVAANVAQYVIEKAITDRGDLPDRALFLLEIIDVSDPKEDTLARVCTVADLETYKTDRAAAIRAGENYFRAITVTKQYARVGDAILAKDFLSEQVNTVVTEYSTYINAFKADPAEIFNYPMAGAGVLGPAVAAYTAKAAEAAAQTVIVGQLQVTCATTTAEYVAALSTLSDAQATLDVLALSNGAYTALTASCGTLQTASNSLLSRVQGSIDVWTAERANMALPEQGYVDTWLLDPTGLLPQEAVAYRAQRNQFDTQVNSANALGVLSAAVADQTTRVGTAQTDVDTLLAAKESCTLSVATAQQVLNALNTEAARLLTVVQDLCPTFTP
jgi:hypothetical protein